MSKNHPHDNIYSILGKLEALTPKETIVESKAPGFKEYEQVAAKGSVLEGVSKVEQTLAEKYMGFKKLEKSFGSDIENPAALAANIGRKKYGKAKFQKAAAAGKKMGEDIASMGSGMGSSGVVGEEQETCNECGMPMEGCGCPHTNEGETTHKHGVTRHTKTDYPGYPSSDLEDDDEDSGKPRKGRPRKAVTKNPRRDPNAPKKGRGRPSKHADSDKDSSKLPFSSKNKMGHDPFGRVKSSAHDSAKQVDEKAVSQAQQKFMGMVHAAQKGEKAASPAVAKVAKTMTKKAAHDYAATKHKGLPQHVKESITESVNFKRMMEEQHMTLDEMLECMNADMQQFKETGVCSDRLRDMMEVYSHAKRQMEETQGGIGHDLITPQQRLAPHAPAPQGPIAKAVATGKEFGKWLGGQGGPGKEGPTFEESSLEEELNELARLAGLDEVSRGEYIKQQDAKAEKSGKDKFQAFGQEFDTDEVKEDPQEAFEDTCSTCHKDPCECDMDEGNAFGKAVRDAKADGIQPGEKVTVGGKEYPVKEAQDLLAMLRVAGLDTRQLEEALAKDEKSYGETEVDGEDEELANSPDEEYLRMDASTLNPGEADSGEKQQNPDRPTFKNGDNAMAKPPVREATLKLEAQLAAEYESIKKTS